MARIVALAALLLAAHPASAGEVKVVTPGALLSSFKILNPQFEQATGHTVTVTLTPAGAVPRRIEAGETFDVAIAGQRAANDLQDSGKLSGVTLIARSGVGVFVRRGDPKPNV